MTDEIKRVLVVDDEDDLTWSISKHLAKDQDRYELICVNSGKKALEVLSQLPVKLVISDIRMPEISGLELLSKVKESYPNTKVIIMTAYGSSEVHDEANALGCFKYIEKPFEIADLRQLILEALEEKRGFMGTISDFQLSDLIQMNCLGRMTTALYISGDDYEGSIYIEEGNIVHAVCGDKEGQDAMFEMLAWEGGNFSTERGKRSPKETIIKGWQSLLLEGMRRVDESKPGRADMNKEIAKSQQDTTRILEKLVSLKGVILATVFDPEGFPVASQINNLNKEKFGIQEITPMISTLIKQVDSIGEDLKVKNTKNITVAFEKAFLKIDKIINRKEYLVILADNSTNTGVLILESKKNLRKLSSILDNSK
jgi:CheY-like chemotaxis protein/predicted regulator of Ras-like GTPase activity (Roadblock/LC7/MglB family)